MSLCASSKSDLSDFGPDSSLTLGLCLDALTAVLQVSSCKQDTYM